MGWKSPSLIIRWSHVQVLDPKEIFLLEIVRSADPTFEIFKCPSDNFLRPSHKGLELISNEVIPILETTYLDELLKEERFCLSVFVGQTRIRKGA